MYHTGSSFLQFKGKIFLILVNAELPVFSITYIHAIIRSKFV